MTTTDFESELRSKIRDKAIVIVVGSGVSHATNPNAPLWRQLIHSGIERCRSIGATGRWCDNATERLGFASDPEMPPDEVADALLSAAEDVERKLRSSGQFAAWLTSVFEPLNAANSLNSAVIEALVALGAPIITTNYDGLIEHVASDLRAITWKDARSVGKVLLGEDRRVLHLHGYWDEPDSVVLGIRSYERILGDGFIQDALRAFGLTRRFLFVGCGQDGLGDPNFGRFLEWLRDRDAQSDASDPHFRLVLRGERVTAQGSLLPLPYGDDFSQLAGFLARLRPESAAPRRPEPPPRAVPDAVDCYRERLANDTATLTLLGMGRSLQVELPIAEAYVRLRANLTRSLESRPTGKFRDGVGEHETNIDLEDIFRHAARLGHRGVVVLGEPGSGKTTAARQFAWRLASRQCRPSDLGLPDGITPVLLRFRHLPRVLAEGTRSGLREFLLAETHCDEAPTALQSPGTALWDGEAGGLLWILDGLDEVADPETRRNVSGWLQKAIVHRPRDRFLVTCRFAGFFREGVPLPLGPQFVEIHVRPLDDSQIVRFVQEWFRAAYGKLLGAGEQATQRADHDGGELLDILTRPAYQTGHMRELCTNPLLLTILCIVFHEERKLPTGRAELYAHCIRVLLEYWRQDWYAADLGPKLRPYDAEAAQFVLARLAWWLHQQPDRTSAPRAELAAEATLGLAEVSTSSGLGWDGPAFLERMRDESGILAVEGDGRWGFLHLSFQEFLAAEYAVREMKAADLAPRAEHSWWREVALLSLRRSRPFCEAFFRAFLTAGIAERNADLADRCLAESLYFTPGPFLEILGPQRSSHPPARIAAVLRLLRERSEQLPELVPLCLELRQSADRTTQDFAREILQRRGVATADEAEWFDARTGLTYVRIRAGEFSMGGNKYDFERPVHRVRLTKDFGLGKYPVTNAQYAKYLEACGDKVAPPALWTDRRFNQPEQPVVGVSWHDAQAYCKWAGVRLPTEAEWEYACRAGTTTEYFFGDEAGPLGEYAWLDRNSGGQTQPVGTKKPNPWGLHDMAGNVWEWCQDVYDDAYYQQFANQPAVDPPGPSSSESSASRVLRGGCWGNFGGICRSARRYWSVPGNRNRFFGFRVVTGQRESRSEPGSGA